MPQTKPIKKKPIKEEGSKWVWRPPKYLSVEDLENRINQYFNWWCKTKTIYIKTGKDEYEPIEQPIPTISWLALFLWFVNRASMYDYQDKPEYTNTIKRARAFMEQEYEEQLRFNPTWAIFALKNFGRTDKQTMEIWWHNGAPIQMIDLSSKTPKKLDELRKQYL